MTKASPSIWSQADSLRALAVVVLWGLNFVVIKTGLQGLSPMLLGALRFAAASLPFLLWVGKPDLPWRYIIAYGLAQGLGQFGFLFWGLQLGMTAGMASVVMQMQAFFTLLLATPLLGERARSWQLWGLILAFSGLIAIASAHGEGPGQMTLIGFILTACAAFMWACSNIVVRLANQHGSYEPFPFVVWTSVVPIAPFMAISIWTEGWPSVEAQIMSLNLLSIASVLYLAWLATLMAYTLWTTLLQRHTAGKVTPFSLLVPVVGLAAAAAAYGENPSWLQWLGSSAVLMGLVVNQAGQWWAVNKIAKTGECA